ncbi:DNA adenine methylase [Pseudochelatococcus sp. G4_1912]|uniref:DNA adenine methylase n=1 Tax=Pseudochelatococcus sp. G4_1912 TaxID=3114288 RepID=UPI0039C5E0ED
MVLNDISTLHANAPVAPQPIRPLSTLAGYIGGKRVLSKVLVPMIKDIPHTLYCEPFMGMGGVFFRRDARPRVEVVNDLSKDIATFFRVLQRHYQAFLDVLKWQLTSRSEFERLLRTDPDTLTDLERAARFLYLQKLSFGGKVGGRTFGISTSDPSKFDVSRLMPLLEATHERLAGVYIECLPWQKFIDRWDRAHTLFFLDPPYWGVEDYYGKNMFERADFEELSAVLKNLKGKFILTLNDVPEIRELFAWAEIKPVQLKYTASGQPTEASEVIISNVPIRDAPMQ